jgi:hypothetical protein
MHKAKFKTYYSALLLLCLLGSVNRAYAQDLDTTYKAKKPYVPKPYRFTLKAAPVYYLLGYGYKLGLEYTDRKFNDYFVEYSQYKFAFFDIAEWNRREVGYHKSLKQIPYPWYINASILHTQYITGHADDGEGYDRETEDNRIGLGLGFGKKLRIYKNVRLEMTSGLRFFGQRSFDKLIYRDDSVRYIRNTSFFINPMLALKWTISF